MTGAAASGNVELWDAVLKTLHAELGGEQVTIGCILLPAIILNESNVR